MKHHHKHEVEPKGEPMAEPDSVVSAVPETGTGPAVVPEAAPSVAAPEPARKEVDDRLLRLQADFDNYRKRMLKERAEIYKRANEEIMAELIPVLDHLGMALDAAISHDAPKAFVDGFTSVADQLLRVLEKFGLEAMDANGKKFDPNEHEALSCVPSPEVAENMVLKQTRKGYKLGGKMLRAAQVIVSSGKSADPAMAEGAGEGK